MFEISLAARSGGVSRSSAAELLGVHLLKGVGGRLGLQVSQEFLAARTVEVLEEVGQLAGPQSASALRWGIEAGHWTFPRRKAGWPTSR